MGIESMRWHDAETRFFLRNIAAVRRCHVNLNTAKGEVIGSGQLYADVQG